MYQYESLEKFYYKNKIKDLNEEYKKRIENYSAYNTELKINPIVRGERILTKEYPLFYLSINEFNILQERIFLNSKKILELSSKLPNVANFASLNDILTNELIKTNGIEGIHSTKKEMYTSINTEKTTRYSGIINKYKQIIFDNIDKIDSVEQIRKIYDEIFSEDILKNPENRLDGKLFRKNAIKISNGSTIIHSGDLSEESIIKHINELIKFMNKEDFPALIKASIVHYYFEYIHPFYDGNGRFGRFLFSAYLAKKIDVYTGLSLSYAIFENRKKYSELFLNTSKEKNYGELTFFIIGMLNFIIEGQNSIIRMLEYKSSKLDFSIYYLKKIKGEYKLCKIMYEILYIYIQNYIFAKENPLSDKEILRYIDGIKSIQTLKKYLNKLIELKLLSFISKRPAIRCIGDSLKDILD